MYRLGFLCSPKGQPPGHLRPVPRVTSNVTVFQTPIAGIARSPVASPISTVFTSPMSSPVVVAQRSPVSPMSPMSPVVVEQWQTVAWSGWTRLSYAKIMMLINTDQWDMFCVMYNIVHRIGWWENLQETKPLYLTVKTMVSCRFSLKPIHWIVQPLACFSRSFLGWSERLWCASSSLRPGLPSGSRVAA